jgi:GR25 family glycosyltransferase involved in LPS biosynthesis
MVLFNNKKIADIGFYINLDKREDRKQIIESQFEKFNITGVDRFSAISNLSGGPANCKKSHYELYKKLVDSEYDTMLVLEDDCKFMDFLVLESDEIFSDILKTEWDLFWLGCRNRRWPLEHINKCYRSSSVAHTQSYIITKKFAKHILETYPIDPYDNLMTTAIDELLCLSIYGEDVVRTPNEFSFYQLDQPLNDLKTYHLALCYEKSLTTQYSSYSDLWGYVTDWESYITSSFPKK